MPQLTQLQVTGRAHWRPGFTAILFRLWLQVCFPDQLNDRASGSARPSTVAVSSPTPTLLLPGPSKRRSRRADTCTSKVGSKSVQAVSAAAPVPESTNHPVTDYDRMRQPKSYE
eukprot:scpid70196/ scgid11190/ 